MGVVANVHGGFADDERTLAEHQASVRGRALAQIMQGLSGFDEAGEHFWAGRLPKAKDSTTEAFRTLRAARDELVDLQDKEVELFQRIRSNVKHATAAELGMGIHVDSSLTEIVTGDRRVISAVDHVLLQEPAATAGIESNDFQPYYRALSSHCRHLAEDVVGHWATVIRISRFTHEWSDAVMHVINRERDLDPHKEFVGPAVTA